MPKRETTSFKVLMVVLTIMGTAIFGVIGKMVYASMKPDVTLVRLDRLEAKVDDLEEDSTKSDVLNRELLRRLEAIDVKLEAINDIKGDLKVVKFRIEQYDNRK